MQVSTDLLSSLLQDVYAAAAEPARWESFLRKLERVTSSSRSYMILAEDTERTFIVAQTNLPDDFLAIYAERYATFDPLIDAVRRVQRTTGGDWAGDKATVLPDRDFVRLEAYDEMFRPLGDLHLGGILTEDGMAALALRRQRTDPAFEPEVIALLNIITPHLRQALRLHGVLQKERRRGDTWSTSVEAFGTAVIAVDARGCVLEMSAAASALLHAGNGLRLISGTLSAMNDQDDARLRELLSGAAATGAGSPGGPVSKIPAAYGHAGSRAGTFTPSAGGSMRVLRQPPLAPLNVLVIPFSSEVILKRERPAALIFLHDPAQQVPMRGAVMRALYNLTPSHVRLADMLLAGLTLREAAAALGLSEDTARFHLKSIFRLTGVSNQAALLRLMMTLPSIPVA